jgi:cell division cycle protein 37
MTISYRLRDIYWRILMTVHPNVDKASFIRWKQRDVHEKREHMKLRMKQLEINDQMNQELLKRVDRLIEHGASGEPIFKDIPGSVKIAEGDSKEEKPSLAEDGGPEYNDMIEDLLVQIQQEIGDGSDSESKGIEKLKEHKGMIIKAIEVEKKEYQDLLEERSKHITLDDIHTGFDSTIINKPSKDQSKETVTEIETIHSGTLPVASSSASSAPANSRDDDVDVDVKASSDALEYSKIPIGDYREAYKFLSSHPRLVSEKEKDGLMMHAFEQQLDGKTSDMRRTVHNALLIQYSTQLGADGLRRFFSKLLDDNSGRAANVFMEDVKFTSNHIIERCKVLDAEREAAAQEVEQIQLHAVDPNTEITVTVPEPGSPGRLIYDGFPDHLRKAIETRKLDEINKVLADASIAQAEDWVKLLDESGVLSVEEKIYDTKSWEEERKRLQAEADAVAQPANVDDDSDSTSTVEAAAPKETAT